MAEGNGASAPTGKQQGGSNLFQPGQSGNPAGRKLGSRNKLGEAFLADMFDAWKAQGVDAIRRVIDERPQDFLKVVASILPKEIVGEINHRYVLRAPQPASSVDEWLKQNRPNSATTNIQ